MAQAGLLLAPELQGACASAFGARQTPRTTAIQKARFNIRHPPRFAQGAQTHTSPLPSLSDRQETPRLTSSAKLPVSVLGVCELSRVFPASEWNSRGNRVVRFNWRR